MQEQRQKVCRLSQLAQGMTTVQVGQEEILLVRQGDTVHACGGKCPHYGAPLAEGVLLGHEVICPWHNARFDVRTGHLVAPPALDDLPAYQAEVEGDDVYIRGAQLARRPKRTGGRKTVLIVGAGAAGEAAAETLRREGFDGRVVMVTPEEDLPYDRPNLSKDFLAGKAKPEWLPLRSQEFYRQQQIEILKGTRVTALDVRERVAHLLPGGKLPFDLCLIASGGSPRKLSVPGADLVGIFTLRSLADARALEAAAAKASRALIVGAGFLGLEATSALRSRGLQVVVVAPESVPLANILGDGVGTSLLHLHEEYGVEFHLGRTVQEFRGNSAVQEAVLSDGKRLDIDLAMVGIGIMPVVDFLQGSGLVEGGAVAVDARLQTKTEGVFAAGDVAAVLQGTDGGRQRVEHWAVAERQGQHAARAMLGHPGAYEEVPFFWTRQHGVSLKYAGFAQGFEAVLYRGDLERRRFLAGYFAGGRLVAAASIGMGEQFAAAEAILRKKKVLTPEQFRDPGFDLVTLART